MLRNFISNFIFLIISTNGFFSNLKLWKQNIRSYGFAQSNNEEVFSKTYLIEFRGVQPSFRVSEVEDALNYIVQKRMIDNSRLSLEIENIIPDANSNYSVAILAKFPDEEAASEIAKRCCLVRRIIEIWGMGENIDEVLSEVNKNYNEVIAPIFSDSLNIEEKTWCLDFRRYGKGGRTGCGIEARNKILNKFSPILKRLNGKVDLNNPKHRILFLEDWHGYHDLVNTINQAELQLEFKKEVNFTPHFSVLGRVVGKSESIGLKYELKTRPFIGTTTMTPLVAHISANAAMLKPGDLVLDPFCGTGSMMIACAHFGAKVIGTDLDTDCLGIMSNLESSNSTLTRVKNGKFRRPDGLNQENKSVVDNFNYYGFQENLIGLAGADISQWLDGVNLENNEKLRNLQKQYPKFHAIVTDPPYGRREKATKTQTTSIKTLSEPILEGLNIGVTGGDPGMGDPGEIIRLLLRVGGNRLFLGGKLVFWLAAWPGSGLDEEVEVFTLLENFLVELGDLGLRLERVTKEEINDSLLRWMCVLEKGELEL